MIRQHQSPGTLSCRQVRRLLQAYLDGELRDARTVLIADHLDACLRCGLEASSYRWLKAQLAGFAPSADERQLDRLRAFAAALVDEPA
ncbi:MAG: zf-HC2 domain-containing protein [Nitriliruptorales bacterium]|nr:zf-HC2 domain-containing protein [Nitriliruptorales bacterium]